MFWNKPNYKAMSNKIAKLTEQIKSMQPIEKVTFIQVDAKNEGDPNNEYANGDPTYQEFVSGLLDDKRFQWLIYKRQMTMIDIMTAIPTNDPKSAEMRQRAAYRMDGMQMIIDEMVKIKRAYKIAQVPEQAEELNE